MFETGKNEPVRKMVCFASAVLRRQSGREGRARGEKERLVFNKCGVWKDGRGLETLYTGGKDEGETGGWSWRLQNDPQCEWQDSPVM